MSVSKGNTQAEFIYKLHWKHRLFAFPRGTHCCRKEDLCHTCTHTHQSKVQGMWTFQVTVAARPSACQALGSYFAGTAHFSPQQLCGIEATINTANR